MLEIQEKLNLVLENYIEFEKELLGLALATSVGQPEPLGMVADLHTAHRRLINLLSTCRLYFDQVPGNIHALDPLGRNSPLARGFAARRGQERANRLGFRVMEELRDHLQHCGLPLGQVTYLGEWVTIRSEDRRKQTSASG